jgi:hypothetical protein
MERESDAGSCGDPPLDGIGSGLIGRNLLEHGVGIAVLGEPLLGRSAVWRQMHELGIGVGATEDAYRTNGGPLEDGEAQGRVQRERPKTRIAMMPPAP